MYKIPAIFKAKHRAKRFSYTQENTVNFDDFYIDDLSGHDSRRDFKPGLHVRHEGH